jgi:hypothetical protein
MQQDLFITSLRSFDQQADFYNVKNVAQFLPYATDYQLQTNVLGPYVGDSPLEGTRILFTTPSTVTQAVSSYTNSESFTVGGTIGFIPPNLEVGGSVTIGTETTVTVPPVTILNRTNLFWATGIWDFLPVSPVRAALFDVTTGLLWKVDREIYPNGGEGDVELDIGFQSYIWPGPLGYLSSFCVVPTPFQTWDVKAPEITAVEPERVRRGGGSFLIKGAQMYPGIVSDVLLGGDPLAPANFVTIDDTEIRAVVPSGQKVGLTPVQVNTFFNGQTLPSNYDVKVDIRP